MLRYACLLGFSAMAAAHPAMAQSDAEMKACIDRSGGPTSEMLDCGKTEIDKFDARLNAAYNTLMHRELGPQRARLQREQRAWLRNIICGKRIVLPPIRTTDRPPSLHLKALNWTI